MKRVLIAVVAIIAAAAMAAAQTAAPGQQPPTPGMPTPAAPGQKLPGPPTPGQAAPQAPAAAVPQPAPTRSQPQAKTQAEFKAFQDANAKTAPADAGAAASFPAEVEAAANAFAKQYPDSELRSLLYLKAMRTYQNSNNAEKTVDMGRKVLAIDPGNPEALVTVATVLSERTRETDLDREQRLAEATQDAQKALQTVDTDLIVPPNAPADRVQMVKNAIRAMAYAALGTVALANKNYPLAETNFRQSVQLSTAQPDPVTWLRLSVVLDQEKKYQEALAAANKAVEYSADSPPANNLATMERDRLQRLLGITPAAPAAKPAGTAAPTAPAGATPVPAPAKPGTPPPPK